MENLILLIKDVHKNAKDHGWYDEQKKFGEVVSLIHAELSESIEEYRNGNPDHYIVKDKEGNDKPEGVLVELADAVIRIFDYVGSLDKAKEFVSMIIEKHEYNKSRPYKHGGKKI